MMSSACSRDLTTRQAANLLNVSQRTVQIWVEKGVLDAWKTVGGHRRISEGSVLSLLQQRKQRENGAREMTLLLVEEQASQRSLYRNYLEKMDIPLKIHTAEDGFRGLLKIGQIKPDLVLSDLVMPGMDGLQMLQAIRNVKELQSLPIIFITTLAPEQMLEKGFEDKAITVLQKPLAYAALKKAVEENCCSRELAGS